MIFLNLIKDLEYSQQAKISLIIADRKGGFFGKGTTFLCLLRNF